MIGGAATLGVGRAGLGRKGLGDIVAAEGVESWMLDAGGGLGEGLRGFARGRVEVGRGRGVVG